MSILDWLRKLKLTNVKINVWYSLIAWVFFCGIEFLFEILKFEHHYRQLMYFFYANDANLTVIKIMLLLWITVLFTMECNYYYYCYYVVRTLWINVIARENVIYFSFNLKWFWCTFFYFVLSAYTCFRNQQFIIVCLMHTIFSFIFWFIDRKRWLHSDSHILVKNLCKHYMEFSDDNIWFFFLILIESLYTNHMQAYEN